MSLLVPTAAPVPLPFADDLGRHGTRVALHTATEVVTYGELDARVEERCQQLGTERRLVLAVASNTIESIVTYLAALRGEHPVLLAPGGSGDATKTLIDTYDPDVVIEGAELAERHRSTAHELHPELALLLSTSGSTGTPKLVRLSRSNLVANAASIAEYLAITGDDCAITSLPMQYCYGLSVINSHLHTGAGLALTELSVVDACFWTLFDQVGATSFAGVPHTFELLDRVDFDELSLPTLRYVTQAGGRMPAATVRRYAELGQARGWDLVVMYGQTEATARMAYLPPAMAATNPACIGVAVPGGELRIDRPDDRGVGELVYRGANVMLGYARTPDDLATGATIEELHTGDLARCTDDGLFQIVGRRSRFVKPFGVRVDLDDLERHLAEEAVTAVCTGDDDLLVVAVTNDADAEHATACIDARLGLPRSRRRVVVLDEIPRLTSGKPDHGAVRRSAGALAPATKVVTASVDEPVRGAFAAVLQVVPTDDATFVSLGGDSLSYVEMSVRLEALLGELPRDWHLRTVADLAASAPKARRPWAKLDTSVVLRALATLLIVGSHTDLWEQAGGAHALLAIAGYNFGRFQLDGGRRWPSIGRIAAPSFCWIGGLALFGGIYGWRHALFLNGFLGGRSSSWMFWFVEALLQILVLLAVVLAVPAVARAERRRPFLFACGAVAAGLVVRYDVLTDAAWHHSAFRPHEIFWLFAVGWAAARSPRWPQRLLVSAVALYALQGFFGDSTRELIVGGALLLVTWAPRLAVPRALVGPLTTIAAASLTIYLVHMPLHLPLERTYGPWIAFCGSLVGGVLAWQVAERVMSVAGRLRRRLPLAAG
jgi:acyl-CoA synthetase (AMP-forming)/AMP-acid ligase II/acyl carrier protein